MSQTAALIHPPGGRKEGEEEEEVDQTAALIKFSTSGAQRVSVRLQEGGVPGGGNCFFLFFWNADMFSETTEVGEVGESLSSLANGVRAECCRESLFKLYASFYLRIHKWRDKNSYRRKKKLVNDKK